MFKYGRHGSSYVFVAGADNYSVAASRWLK